MKSVFLFDRRPIQPALIEAFNDFTFTTQPVTGCRVLLRWGNTMGNDEDASLVINRKQPLKACFDKEKTFQTLRINKVRRPRLVIPKPDSRYPLIGKRFDPTTGFQREQPVTDFQAALMSASDFFVESVNTVKKYNIYIYNLNIFFITKKMVTKTHDNAPDKIPLWNYEEIPKDLDQDTQKLGLLAQRASYVLGLDFCMVHAGIDVYGRPVVLDVSSVPAMPVRAVYIFHDLIRHHLANQVLPVLESGGVPALNSDRQLHPQIALFSDTPDAKNRNGAKKFNVRLGADPEFMLRNGLTGQLAYPSEFLEKEGSIGYDERSEGRQGILFPLAEFRPEPDICPLRLTEKIRALMVQALSLIPSHVAWLAGSMHFDQYQLGGHIHFSNLLISSRLLRALDNYLGLPVMLLENPETSARRRKQYGWIGSIRCKPHGGFEYRTPASWLVSPEITRGCLCLAKIVATEYPDLTKDYLVDPDLQKAFYQGKKYYFYDIYSELWHDIEKTSLYGKYASYLAPLHSIILKHAHWDENVDLRQSWGLLSPANMALVT